MLVNQYVSPGIRELGLTGSAGRYVLPSDQVWARVGLQKSTYSDSQEVRFAVNLLAVDKTTWVERSGGAQVVRPPSANVGLGDNAAWERLAVLSVGWDEWWRVSALGDPAPIAASVLSAMEGFGAPWLLARLDEQADLKL